MPKIKTHRGAAKRFKKKPGGGIKCKNAYTRHILTKKSSKLKRQMRGISTLEKCDEASVIQMLPNS